VFGVSTYGPEKVADNGGIGSVEVT
jgi:hypothetical protein